MNIISTNVYVGPNRYARFPVIRHVLDLGILEDWPTVKLGNKFIDTLLVGPTLPVVWWISESDLCPIL